MISAISPGIMTTLPLPFRHLTTESRSPQVHLGSRSRFSVYQATLVNISSSPQIGLRVGLGYTYRINTHWKATTGLHYWWQKAEGLARVSSETTFDFGMVEKDYGLRATHLHYMAVPLLISYSTNQWQIEAGLDFDYLVGANGKTELLQLERTETGIGAESDKGQIRDY